MQEFADGWPGGAHHLPGTISLREQKRTDKTTPCGVNLMRSQVLSWAAQVCPCNVDCALKAKAPVQVTPHCIIPKQTTDIHQGRVLDLSNDAGCKQTLCMNCCACTCYVVHNQAGACIPTPSTQSNYHGSTLMFTGALDANVSKLCWSSTRTDGHTARACAQAYSLWLCFT